MTLPLVFAYKQTNLFVAMGIRGLYSFIFWSASKIIQRETLSQWSGKKLGIDILCLLYRSRSVGIPLLWNLSHFISACKLHNIELVVVFDGSPPPEKSEIMAVRKKQREDTDKLCTTLEGALERSDLSTEQRDLITEKIAISRRNVPQIRSEDRDIIKQLLYATGVPFVHSLGEADALLAYLARRGEIDAVVSTDYDFLARGVKNLLVPSSENLADFSFHHFMLPEICKEIGLTEEQFRQFACLLGTDYAPGIGRYTSRLLYRRFKVCGSLDVLMDRLHLSTEKKENVRHSLQELNLENKVLDDLLRSEQQAKMMTPTPIEPEWILPRIETGEICPEMKIFV